MKNSVLMTILNTFTNLKQEFSNDINGNNIIVYVFLKILFYIFEDKI